MNKRAKQKPFEETACKCGCHWQRRCFKEAEIDDCPRCAPDSWTKVPPILSGMCIPPRYMRICSGERQK